MSSGSFLKNGLFLCLCAALTCGGCKPLQPGQATVSGAPDLGHSSNPAKPTAPPSAPKTTEGPGWDAVRNAILVPKNCYAKNAEFCVRDPAFVNPVIQAVLDERYDGVMPMEPEKIEAVSRSARHGYTSALFTPDGRRRIEALIDARFRNPVITDVGNGVTIDLGHVPAKLSVYNYELLPSGEPLDGHGYWKSSEVAKTLKDTISAYPNAEDIVLVINIPSGSSDTGPIWKFLYNKRRDRLIVRDSATIRGFQFVQPFSRDFSAYLSGEKSLYDNLVWDKSRERNW